MRDTIFKIIDKFVEGVDTYNNNGSMWLIFTDEKKWVIELTKEGTLWYNYYFFQDCFKYVSLDVVENQHYITEWVETIIQNGVKYTKCDIANEKQSVEDTIQNGVKKTVKAGGAGGKSVEDTIQNGIKKTEYVTHNLDVEKALKNGIKETIELPDKSGELNGYGDYYDRQEDRTKPHTQYVDDVVLNGIKETNHCSVSNDENARIVIQNGIKETKYCELHSLMRADHIIRDGIKETNWRKVDNHPTYLDSIIDEGSHSGK